MPTNEQHLQLVLDACEAKRADDMRNTLNIMIAAFCFGTGCAFVLLVTGAIVPLFFSEICKGYVNYGYGKKVTVIKGA